MNDIVLVISKHAMIDIEICLDRYSLTSAFVLTSAAAGLAESDDVLVCIISPQSEGMRGNIQTVTLDAAGQAQASFHTHFQNRYVQSGTRGENIFPVCQFRAQFGNLCESDQAAGAGL